MSAAANMNMSVFNDINMSAPVYVDPSAPVYVDPSASVCADMRMLNILLHPLLCLSYIYLSEPAK